METSELVNIAYNFMDTEYKSEVYRKAGKGSKRIVLDYRKLAEFNPEVAELLLDDPENTMAAFEMAAKSFEDSGLTRVRFKNLTNIARVPISELREKHIGKIIQIEGIIKQKGGVRPHIIEARFECPGCGNILRIIQMDEKHFKEPSRCGCGRKGHFKKIELNKIDVFPLMLEEPAEDSASAKLTQHRVLFKEDLCEPKLERLLNPGIRVVVTGILKEIQIEKAGIATNQMDWYTDANYVDIKDETYASIRYSQADIDTFKKFSTDQKDVIELLRSAIFQDIYGYIEETAGVTLQMFGGVELSREGANARGTIHALLVGDPGCEVGTTILSSGNGTFVRFKNAKSLVGKQVLVDRRFASDNPHRLVTDFLSYKQQPVLRIVLETGKELILTHNHPLWTKEKHKGQFWKRADQFVIGDKVKVICKIPCNKESYEAKNSVMIDEFLARTWGYLIGDGGAEKYKINVYFNEEEQDLLPLILAPLEKMYGKHAKSATRASNRGLIDGRIVNRTQEITVKIFYSKRMAEFFNLVKQPLRVIPDEILSSKNTVLSAFLAGLFEADGCIIITQNKDRTPKPRVQLKSSSHQLLLDVQTLLLRFGISARVHEDNLFIAKRLDVEKYAENIGFLSKKKQNALAQALTQCPRKEVERKASAYEKIVKIESAGVEDVYDITVPDGERFIANGIVSHNSAKSTILKIAQKFSPKAIYVAGKGVSGVGITASVVKDELLGGYNLEAGPLVMANDGIVMIDELDKMDDQHKQSLHEPMEQQTVTISKAGITATLPSRTSILAAANPKFGSYSEFDTVYSQIELAPTLINRFDLVYPIKESKLSKVDDYNIAMKMLSRDKVSKAIVDRSFIRKYIAYARTLKPIIPDAIKLRMAETYSEIKDKKRKSQERSIPISARNLDAFRRLAEATARARLHDEVREEDMNFAYQKLIYSISQLGIDPTTGAEEITITDIGGFKRGVSKKDLHAKIMAFIRSQPDGAYYDDIKNAAEGIDDTLLDEIIHNLSRNGDIFSPKHGFWRTVG
jgi:DNA replicative helicase MCM subunit Mcm2 (Cdc46/Mcm family)